MKRVLTACEMREADEYTINKKGVPSLELMERAGSAVADAAENAMEKIHGKSILIVCGGGNNGGDGFAAARLLEERGVAVTVLCTAENFSENCIVEKERYEGKILHEIPYSDRYDVIVDCIFGTGISREVAGKEALLISFINESGSYILAVDIPSGLNGNNGLIHGLCVYADETITIGEYKTGLFLNEGTDVCGLIKSADIGIELPKKEGKYTHIATDSDIAVYFPKRKRNTHKGNYGKVSILAGSKSYSGAPSLSAMAALRAGAGYTELCVPQGMFFAYVGRLPEVILTPMTGEEGFEYNEYELEKVLKSQCITFGVGCGVRLENYKIIRFLLENYTGKLVLDADALNTLSKYGVSVLKNKKCEILLTPHLKEFSRLSRKTADEIRKNGIESLKKFADEYEVAVLLKNAVSVLYGENKTYLNIRGGTCLAKGGSGDALGGVIGSICAQGYSLTEAALAGAYVFGVAAELCEDELGQYSVTTGDVILKIPEAILRITENSYK